MMTEGRWDVKRVAKMGATAPCLPVRGRMDDDVRPADVAAELFHARQDLLVDAVLPGELRMIGEEAE